MNIYTSPPPTSVQGELDLQLENSTQDTPTAQFLQPSPKRLTVDGLPLHEFLLKKNLHKALLLENLLSTLDWEPFLKAYPVRGRTALHPRLILGLILLGKLNGIHSLRALQSFAAKDLEAWYLTGGVTPDHATIGLFLVRHQETMAGPWFEDLTKVILKGTVSRTVGIDGTTIQAQTSPDAMMTAQELEKLLAQVTEEGDEFLVEKLKIALAVVQERDRRRKELMKNHNPSLVSPHEPDAILQPMKEGHFRPLYRASIAVDEERIIRALAVDPTSETAVVGELLDQAERTGGPVEQVLADAGYFSDGILKELEERAPDSLVAPGKASNNFKVAQSQLGKEFFTYDETTKTVTCPAGNPMAYKTQSKAGEEPAWVQYISNPKVCEKCPLREKCLSKDNNKRTVKFYPEMDPRKDRMRAKFQEPKARQRFGVRMGIAESPFSWIKTVLGFRRFFRRGLALVKMEWSLCCGTYNVMKWMKRLQRA
jgi:hypothetical protein